MTSDVIFTFWKIKVVWEARSRKRVPREVKSIEESFSIAISTVKR